MGMFSFSVTDNVVKLRLFTRLKLLFCKNVRIKAEGDDCYDEIEFEFNVKEDEFTKIL